MTIPTAPLPARRSALAGQLLLSFVAVVTSISPILADFNATHIFNPLWLPHARFHAGHASPPRAGQARRRAGRRGAAEGSIVLAETVTARHARRALAAQRGTNTAKFPGLQYRGRAGRGRQQRAADGRAFGRAAGRLARSHRAHGLHPRRSGTLMNEKVVFKAPPRRRLRLLARRADRGGHRVEERRTLIHIRRGTRGAGPWQPA